MMTLAQALSGLPQVIALSDTQLGLKSPLDILEKRLAAYRLQEAALFLWDWRQQNAQHAYRFSTEEERDSPGNVCMKGVNQNSVVEAEFQDESAAYDFVQEMNWRIQNLVETLDEKPWRHTASFEYLIERLNEIEWNIEQMPGVLIKSLDRFGAHGDLLLSSVQAELMSREVAPADPDAPQRRQPSL